jgi:hypothetical protein
MTSKPRSRNLSAAEVAAAHQRKLESRQRKEQFLIFIKALMRDLAQMDPAMHARAKKIIQECTEKKKQRVRGFDFELTMRTRLLDCVGESNWRRVERDLHKRNSAHCRKGEPKREEPKRQPQSRSMPCSTDISLSSDTSTASISITSVSDEPDVEARQQPTERSEKHSAVTLGLTDLSLSDESVEVEILDSKHGKVHVFNQDIVQKTQSRPPAAAVCQEEPRYIYI